MDFLTGDDLVAFGTKSTASASLWHATNEEALQSHPLQGDVSCDLVVVGGGFTGCSAAWQAATMGASVRVLEAATIGHGGSGRNVGLVNAGLWLPPEDITKTLGNAAGTRLNTLLAQAPEMVFDLIARHDITCEATRAGTLHCAHAPSGMKALRERHKQLRAIGAPVELLSATEAQTRVGSTQVHGALFDPRAGTIQPLAYVCGLARAASEAGAQIHENTPATAIRTVENGWQIVTPSGTVTAQNLIVATNAYHLNLAGMENPEYVPVHYFQMATEPLPEAMRANFMAGKEGCWDTALVMSSWRMDAAGRLVIGGMGGLDHPGAGVHIAWCQRKLAQMFPALAGAVLEFTWCGRIAMTGDHLPRIMAMGSEHHKGYAAFGFSGRGIGPGTVFGTRMAQALLNNDEALLPLDPVVSYTERLSAVRQCYYESGATLLHFAGARIG